MNAPGYIGCFEEGDGCANADSNQMQKTGAAPTTQRCRYLAGALGAAYAGPEYHNDCYTSTITGSPSDLMDQNRSADGMCNAVCSGSNESTLEYCGGACILSLYTALQVPPANGRKFSA